VILMRKITPAQCRKIHILAKEQGIDNDTLHAHIYAVVKKDSIKELSIMEAVKVIDSLSGNEVGKMTYRQREYIFKLAKELKWVDAEGKVNIDILNGFIKKQVNVHAEQWLTQKQASIVIDAMKAINKRDIEQKKKS